MPRVSRAEFLLRGELDRRGIWYRQQYRIEFPRTFRIGARSVDLVLKSKNGKWIALDFETSEYGAENVEKKFAQAMRSLGYRLVRLNESDVQENPKAFAAKLIRELKPETRVKRDADARRLILAAVGKHLPNFARRASNGAGRKGAA